MKRCKKMITSILTAALLLGLMSMNVFAAEEYTYTVTFLAGAQGTFSGNDDLSVTGEGYSIEIIKGDMSKTLPFEDESFDIIFHPVSNSYVEDVYHIWNECYRVLKNGGRLLAGMDNGINYLFEEDEPLKVVNPLPFNPLKMSEEKRKAMIANGDGVQFSHTLDEQIGGQLKTGFILKDLYEDRDREGGNEIGKYYPQYFATLAVK